MIKVLIADKNKDKIEGLVSDNTLRKLFLKAIDYFDLIKNASEFVKNQEIRKLIVDGYDFYTYRLNATYRMIFTINKDENGNNFIIIIDVISHKELYDSKYMRDLPNYN